MKLQLTAYQGNYKNMKTVELEVPAVVADYFIYLATDAVAQHQAVVKGAQGQHIEIRVINATQSF